MVGCSSSDAVNEAEHSDTSDWQDGYDQREAAKADSSACSAMAVPDPGPFGKRVALTFDDGPNPQTTPKVLDVLAQYGAKATFFINGERASSAAARSVIDRIRQEGHLLANHSQNHKNLKKVSLATADEQIRLTHEVIASAGESRRYFRFPYGSAKCSGIARAKDYGYIVTGWQNDSADWCFAERTGGVGHCAASVWSRMPDDYRSDMVGYSLSQLRDNEGGLILFHDIHQFTADNIEAVIAPLAAEGYVFVTADDVTSLPKLNSEPSKPRAFVGDPCVADEDCDFEVDGQAAVCAKGPAASSSDGGFCSVSCEGFCPDQAQRAPTFCTTLVGTTGGSCVARAHALNGECNAIPKTRVTDAERFIGESGASELTASVCLPP